MFASFKFRLAAFSRDRRGNIALMTGLLAVPLIAAVGLAVDYSRAVSTRQQLDTAAQTAATQAIGVARAAINAQTAATYHGDDDTTTNSALQGAEQAGVATMASLASAISSATSPSSQATITRTGETLTATVHFSASVPTSFSQIVGYNAVPVGDTVTVTGSLMDVSSSGDIVNQVWDSGYTLSHNLQFNGWILNLSSGFEEWSVGYGPDRHGVLELDAWSNGYVTKKVYLAAGSYELRYFYRARVDIPQYDPAYICGSKSSDVDWDQWTASGSFLTRWSVNGTVVTRSYMATPRVFAPQTNRIGVYLDAALSDTPPGQWSPSTNNLVDVCTYAAGWVQRVVSINVNTPGYYWLTFQGEGASDGFGGLLGSVRLCVNTCVNPFQWDNFPWAQNPYATPQVLFSDDFNTPFYPTAVDPQASQPPANEGWWDSGTLDQSGTNSGWTSLPAGWTTAPYDQIDFNTGLVQSPSGTPTLDMDATNGSRAISRRFLLDPGYYEIDYVYGGGARMQLSDLSSTMCGPNPAAVNASAFTNTYIAQQGFTALASSWASTTYAQTGTAEPYNAQSTNVRNDTDQMSLFVDSDQLYSHPVEGTGYYSTTTFANSDGTTANLLPSLPNNVIETCLYASAFSNRSDVIRIDKPGYYWISWRAEGAGGNVGPLLANVRLTALGGLTMSSPPSNATDISPPAPSVGSPIDLSGISVTAQ